MSQGSKYFIEKFSEGNGEKPGEEGVWYFMQRVREWLDQERVLERDLTGASGSHAGMRGESVAVQERAGST